MNIKNANFIDKWDRNCVYGTNYNETIFTVDSDIKVKEKYLYYYSVTDVDNIIEHWKSNPTIIIEDEQFDINDSHKSKFYRFYKDTKTNKKIYY